MIFVADNAYKELLDYFAHMDRIVPVPKTERLYAGVQNHADLHVFIAQRTVFLSQELNRTLDANTFNRRTTVVQKPLGTEYPFTALLNGISTETHLIANPHILYEPIINEAVKEGIHIIPVKQGYVRCTTIPLPGNRFITDDQGIYKTLTDHGLESLLVSRGSVLLEPFEYGFIGGAAGLVDNILCFNGDISKHPDYMTIKKFCSIGNIEMYYIEERPLKDIGGILQTPPKTGADQ